MAARYTPALAGLCAALALAVSPAVRADETPRKQVRICDETGCSMRDAASAATILPGGEQKAGADQDVWRGEPAAELQAAAAQGDAVAAYKLGTAYLGGYGGVGVNKAKAVSYLRQAAEAGHGWAQARLAQLYYDGSAGRKDVQAATTLAFKAAGQGVPSAAYNVGMMYLNGNGAPRNEAEAARWFEVAAKGGQVEAQMQLALMYLRGIGVQRQPFDGLAWMRKAAENGRLEAQVSLGRVYLTGFETVGQDLGEARSWLSTAAGRGSKEAKSLLAEVDRAERENREFLRALRLEQARTSSYLAALAFRAWLAPPPITIVRIW